MNQRPLNSPWKDTVVSQTQAFVWRTVKASSKKIKSQEYIPLSHQEIIEINKMKQIEWQSRYRPSVDIRFCREKKTKKTKRENLRAESKKATTKTSQIMPSILEWCWGKKYHEQYSMTHCSEH